MIAVWSWTAQPARGQADAALELIAANCCIGRASTILGRTPQVRYGLGRYSSLKGQAGKMTPFRVNTPIAPFPLNSGVPMRAGAAYGCVDVLGARCAGIQWT